MKILGISALYHDSACALIDNGDLVCAVQEEAFTRKKHDASFPVHSIEFCLKQISQNIKESIKKVDYIAYYDKPFLSFERILETYLNHAPLKGLHSFLNSMPLWLGKKLNMYSLIKKEIKRKISVSKKDIPEILFNYHHLSHASSAFYPSPYQKSAILCLDGVGEWATTSAWIGEGRHIKPLWQINFPHSLGLFYSTFTDYCGFKINSGEYKLMGLAPYGQPRYTSLLEENVIKIKEDGSFQLNMDYFDYPHSLQMSSSLLNDLLKRPPAKKEQIIDLHYMDVACSVQKIVEKIVIRLSNTLYNNANVDNLCMAGGVALNCVANGKILKETPFQSLWIQPASGDAGGAIGAALSVWYDFLKKPRIAKKSDSMKGSFLGPIHSSCEIEKVLKKEGAIYKKYDEKDIICTIVDNISRGRIVGHFQGRMEFGPRALGNRSIFGNPRLESMQDKMNKKIKFRESFRPFAISILEEKIGDFFENVCSPYMLLTSHILRKHRKNEQDLKKTVGFAKQNIIKSFLPSCTHVDYSCRIQTVKKNSFGNLRKILELFYDKTSCPGVINTSFNVRGEPMVCSPYEAYRCFMNTSMDICIIGNYLLIKEEQKINFKDNYIKGLEVD